VGIREFICRILNCSEKCESEKKQLKDSLSFLHGEFDRLRELYFKAKSELSACRGEHSQIPAPKVTGEIDWNELRSILKEKFPDAKIYLSDGKYKLAPVSEIKRFLEKDNTDKYKYQVTYFDCDNYSYRLMGNASTPEWASLAFGICWTQTHAFNIFVGSDKKAYLIEPQSDKVYEYSKAYEQYKKLKLIVM